MKPLEKLNKYQPAMAPPVPLLPFARCFPVIMNYLAPHLSTDLAHIYDALLSFFIFHLINFSDGRKFGGVSTATVIFCLPDRSERDKYLLLCCQRFQLAIETFKFS